MNFPRLLAGLSGCLLGFLTLSPLEAADNPAAAPARPATIFFSAAPWDGAAYDLEIPLEKTGESAEPCLRIDLWGSPEFQGPTTLRFTGKEDPGGGPLRGDGRALFQAQFNKSMPVNLAGTISFEALRKNEPVLGSYELETLDGKRVFKGQFKAVWGNTPLKVIR